MKNLLKFAVPAIAALAISACSGNPGGTSSVPGASGATGSQPAPIMQQVSPRERQLWGPNVVPACGAVRAGQPQCLALVRTDIPARMHPAAVAGLAPADFQAAYKLPSAKKGGGQIVAIVDAFDNPNVATDLATYRSNFGLPPATFKKYNQTGQQSNYPQGDVGWGLEIDLDVDMVSASCPKCTIYLIESNGSLSDMQTAETEAVTLGAHIVTNSWICYGSAACVTSSAFSTPGVTYLASSGDIGYGEAGAPMAFPSVVAVGGSTLSKNSSKRGWIESAWSGSGSGCVTGVTKPSWQHDPDCSSRMTADVGADADPSTGAAEYDSYGYGGWVVVGGTSLASPLLAGVFALAGDATTQNGGETFWTKVGKVRHLYHVNSGSNGTCSPTYFCTDGTHEYGAYGGPTGWGTPNGVGQF